MLHRQLGQSTVMVKVHLDDAALGVAPFAKSYELAVHKGHMILPWRLRHKSNLAVKGTV